jgi:probable HAF family extracellular repeat protein
MHFLREKASSLRSKEMKSQFLSLALLVLITSTLMGQSKYSVTDLGVLSGRTSNSAATSINDNGVVAITLPTQDPTIQAFKWNQSLQNLSGQTSGENSVARGINFNGDVAGWTSKTFGVDQAVIYTNGGVVPLPIPANTSRALAISDSGQVAGEFTDNTGTFGFLWDAATGLTQIGTLPGAAASSATAVNTFQDVVGYSTTPTDSYPHKAIIWTRQSGMRVLLPKFAGSTVAYGINGTGTVVGYAMNKTSTKAFVVTAAGRTTYYELPAVSRTATSYAVAYGISEKGQVVGESNTRAFLIDNGTIVDLNTLIPVDSGWTLSTAYGINSSGQIVGVGMVNNEAHAFLLSPEATTATSLTKKGR